jgi:hypothetical protein
MYSTIGSGTASQATPQGRRHKRAEAGFEMTIKLLPARCLDRYVFQIINFTLCLHVHFLLNLLLDQNKICELLVSYR